MSNNKDIFGIKRGPCDCNQCPQYCISNDNFCSYCGCVPVKHRKIGKLFVMLLIIRFKKILSLY